MNLYVREVRTYVQVHVPMWRSEEDVRLPVLTPLYLMKQDVSLNLTVDWQSPSPAGLPVFVPTLRVHNSAWLFTWELEIRTQVLTLVQQVLLPAEPSPQSPKGVLYKERFGPKDRQPS